MWLAVTSTTLWRGIAAIALVASAAAMLWFFRSKRAPAGSFLDHVEDLRRRLIISLAAVVTTAGFLFSFDWAPGSAYPVPALSENLAARLFQRVAADLVPETVTLTISRPLDGFSAELGIAFAVAAVLMSPIVAWQLGGFAWPALREQEQRVLLQTFVPVVGLFLTGAAFAYFFVLPFLLRTLYAYGPALNAQGLLPVSEFITFVMGMVLIFGIAFQTPLVMWALSRVGLVPGAFWRKQWRIAVIVIVVLAALLTDPTVVSQVMVAAPLIFLYVVGMALAVQGEKAHAKAARN